MKTTTQSFTLRADADISACMETHDGFELVENGLAEFEESPTSFMQGKSYVEVDAETLHLLHDLVAAGICPDTQHAVNIAVHSYILAALPHSYKVIRAQ